MRARTILTILLLCLITFTTKTFPSYYILKTLLAGSLTYLIKDSPVWVKLLWWSVVTHDFFNNLENAVTSSNEYNVCKVFEIVHSLLSNGATFMIGWKTRSYGHTKLKREHKSSKLAKRDIKYQDLGHIKLKVETNIYVKEQ